MTIDFSPAPILTSREASLGSLLRLPDSLIIERILILLAPKDLCSLALTSRYMHVFARNDFVWRRLFFAERDSKSTRLVYRGNWLLTYLFHSPEHDEACSSHPLVICPVQIQDVSSDYLSLQWHRSNMFFGHFYPPPPISPTPTLGDQHSTGPTIPIEDYQDLDEDVFYRRYGYPNKPVMIQNSNVESWPAWKQWTLDALAAKHSDTVFRVSNIESDTKPSFSLCFKDFLHYLKYNRDLNPFYLFDPCFAEAVPEMGTAYEVPKYFRIDYFSLLKGSARPPYRWILIGPQRTGAPWHIDPSGTSAWNTLLSGHKRWALYPPHITPPGHDPSSSERKTSVAWYLDVYPYLQPEARPIEIIQHPGQTIYVPSGWWHMVLNMDNTVAVTQNFADETNFSRVKQAMLSDKTEISQFRRWELLAEALPTKWPELSSAVEVAPEELLQAKLEAESSWLDPASTEAQDKWQERVRDVIFRSTGVSDPGNIISIQVGQNMCFLSDSGFVKFFTPLHDGHVSFVSEIESNKALQEAVLERPQDDILSFPKMLGHGYLLATDQVAASEWRWPYIITENMQCIHPDYRISEVPHVTAHDFTPRDKQGYYSLLGPILRTLHYMHTLDMDLLKKQDYSSMEVIPRESIQYTVHCLRSAAVNHARWRVFPKQLLRLLPSYLPNDPKDVFDPTKGDRVATLVHGDINPGNIMGLLDVNVRPFADPSVNVPQYDLRTESVAASKDFYITFKPTLLLDFGDAAFSSDPLIDIVSVFVTILNCRHDLGMTQCLLDYWRALTKDTRPQSWNSALARRCMWHVLLWPSVGLSLHLVRCIPEIAEMLTWEEVEDAVFGWWSHLEQFTEKLS